MLPIKFIKLFNYFNKNLHNLLSLLVFLLISLNFFPKKDFCVGKSSFRIFLDFFFIANVDVSDLNDSKTIKKRL